MWHCWPSEPGSHTELWGRLACCLSTAEENNWWHFAHSPQRYLTITDHCSHCSNWWCHPEGFWEDSWQRGVAGLGWWHSKPHHLPFKGHHWCTVDNIHPAHRTCQVICTSCSPYCAGLGVQTVLSWRHEHRVDNMAFNILMWLYSSSVARIKLQCFCKPLFIQGSSLSINAGFFLLGFLRNALPHTYRTTTTALSVGHWSGPLE